MATHGILVTYERAAEVRKMFAALRVQDVQFATLVIVDNSAAPSLTAVDIADLHVAATIEYVFTGDNLGPAGGLAAGVERLLASDRIRDDDWIVFIDDDDPPGSRDLLHRLHAFAEQTVACDPRTGAVGPNGATLDRRTGSLHRPADADLIGRLRTDYIGGGQFPFYRAAALREVGPPRADLFFGFDDLELGLRLQAAGYNLWCDGALWYERRSAAGRLNKGRSLADPMSVQHGWRTYYSHRNLILILRQYGFVWAAALRTALLVAKPMTNLRRSPADALRLLVLTLRSVTHGWRGVAGRTVSPPGLTETPSGR